MYWRVKYDGRGCIFKHFWIAWWAFITLIRRDGIIQSVRKGTLLYPVSLDRTEYDILAEFRGW
jgi:hypothetical protein